MKELRLTEGPRRPENRRPIPRPANGTKPSQRSETLDIFADPPPRRPPTSSGRPRRNSEGSLAERKILSPEEEQKRRERRHREREQRHKDSKGRPIPSKSRVPNRRLDVIDKLDVTSIFGTGVFHHDGPFDACNPARNRKGSSRAPMAAFPKDSANNVIGGSGPLNKNIDLDQFHGRLPDGFQDFSAPAGRKNSSNQMDTFVGYPRVNTQTTNRESVLNTNSNIEPVHGDETLGLGTSTFLEGAPAARAAIQRRESEADDGGGLSRKKSLVQKIRGVSNARGIRNQDVNSPGPRWDRPTSPDALQVQSAGGLGKITEKNPFFQDYDAEYAKKGASIKIAEAQRQEGESSRVNATEATSEELQRTTTETSIGGGEEGKTGGGFMNRVKSLRTKKRPERKE